MEEQSSVVLSMCYPILFEGGILRVFPGGARDKTNSRCVGVVGREMARFGQANMNSRCNRRNYAGFYGGCSSRLASSLETLQPAKLQGLSAQESE